MSFPAFNFTKRLLPIIVLDRVDDALPLADALLEAGMDTMEITLRTPAALPGIEAIRRAHPTMNLGAGTVLDAESVLKVVDLGVNFAVAPGLNETVVAACAAQQLTLVPGFVTPSEFERGCELGLKFLKFFPAEAAGGAKYLTALAGPYEHTGVKFVPTGGIDATRLGEYLKIPMVAAVGGSWFVNRKLIAERNWAEITRLTKVALEIE